MIKWQLYPKSKDIPEHLKAVINKVFEVNDSKISSDKHKYDSNTVLGIIRKDLEVIGFDVESGKNKSQKINIPILFGQNGKPEKSFDADGWNKNSKTVIEVEAGRFERFISGLRYAGCGVFDHLYKK